MHKHFELDLQRFADGGGDGGTGDGGNAGAANSGVTAAVAAQPNRSLEELGVPRDRIERLNKRRARAAASADGGELVIASNRSAEGKPADQAAAGENQTSEAKQKPQESAKRLTWDEIKADPEYNKEMQKMMQARLKSANASEETLAKLSPILEALGAKYNLDTSDLGKLDIDALRKAVDGDASYYEQKADELGVSPETARQLDQFEKMKQRQEEERRQTIEQQTRQQHYMKLVQQSEEMKKVFPNFDLQTELQNPTFLRMTSPQIGLSVEDAYYAVHRAEIQQAAMQATARNVQESLARSVQANAQRPSDNTSAQASSLASIDYKNMSRQQREALRSRIRTAGARGEKLYPQDVFLRK